MASSYTIQPRQNLFDVALIAAGSADAVFDIAWQNSLSVTDELLPGTELQLNALPSSNTVNLYQVYSISPATAIDSIDFASTIAGDGIEFWTIEFNFTVS